jgi:hypothetical protein
MQTCPRCGLLCGAAPTGREPFDGLWWFGLIVRFDVPHLRAADAHVHQGVRLQDRVDTSNIFSAPQQQVSEGPQLSVLKLGDIHVLKGAKIQTPSWQICWRRPRRID